MKVQNQKYSTYKDEIQICFYRGKTENDLYYRGVKHY